MSATKLCEKPCETCQKQGLPILLTRYAVLTDDSRAPKLSGHLNNTALNDIPLQGQAHYGLRLLRTGYVYVYDEARKRMDEYFVTTDGFLTKMPMRQIMLKNAQHKPATEFACARNGFAPIAGLITIPKPQYATTIWISFSDAAWTNKTYLDHMDTSKAGADLRKQHMQDISIQAGKIAPQLYTAPIEEVSQHVAEFNKQTIISSFAKWSPFAFNKRVESESFKNAIKTACPNGGAAIVALHDPVGVAAELVALINYKQETFMSRPDRQRGLWLESQLHLLEGRIKDEAMLKKVSEAIEHNLKTPNPGLHITPEQLKARAEAEASQTWAGYSKKIDFNEEHHPRVAHVPNYQKRKDFNQKLKSEFETYRNAEIKPLIESYLKWHQSEPFKRSFICNFDDTNIKNGQEFAHTLVLSMLNSQEHPECTAYYADELLKDIGADTNIIIRGFILNQKVVADIIHKTNSVDPRKLPWDAVIGSMKEALKGLTEQESNVRYLTAMAGGISRYLAKSTDTGFSKLHAYMAIGAAQLNPIVPLTMTGNRWEFREAALKWAEQQFGVIPNKKEMDARMKMLGLYEDLKGRQTKTFTISASPDLINNMPRNLTENQKVDWVLKHITTPEKLEQYYLDKTKLKMITPQGIKLGARIYTPYGLSVVAGILQYLNYQTIVEDADKLKTKSHNQYLWRYYAGWAAMLGTISEGLGMLLEQTASKMGQYASVAAKIGKFLTQSTAKLLGAAAGVVTGAWDVYAGGVEIYRGNVGLGTVQVGMGFLGILAAYLFFASAFLFGFVIVAVIIVVGIIVELVKDNPLQDWLERCWFGNLTTDTYDDVTERSEFKLAIEAMR